MMYNDVTSRDALYETIAMDLNMNINETMRKINNISIFELQVRKRQ